MYVDPFSMTHLFVVPDVFLRGMSLMYERQRYDGWYNNMAHPDWGAVGTTTTT